MGLAIKCDRCGVYQSPSQPMPINATNWMAPGWMGLRGDYDINRDVTNVNITLCQNCKSDFNLFMGAKRPMTKAAS